MPADEPATGANVVSYRAITPTPWKNGRGVTRTLFSDADAAGRWSWRVSVAEITGTQPYSPYPGVRRGQVALGPGEVDLEINGPTMRLAPEGVVSFDGEDAVTATPMLPGFLDLNIMTRRADWVQDVSVVDDPGTVAAGTGQVVILVALHDAATCDGAGCARLDGIRVPEGAAVTAEGRFVVARLRRA